jgi:hypothetical protein
VRREVASDDVTTVPLATTPGSAEITGIVSRRVSVGGGILGRAPPTSRLRSSNARAVRDQGRRDGEGDGAESADTVSDFWSVLGESP